MCAAAGSALLFAQIVRFSPVKWGKVRPAGAHTKDNLAWRVDCEFGATQGKFDLAACCKKNNLDALHDTIHEMAKDEARHGKALQGLLNRYFK